MLQKEFSNELLLAQMEVKEQTLRTVAHDLHDNIGQLLSLIIVTLSTLEIKDDDKANQKVSYLEDLTARSIKEVKMLSRLLHGEDLLKNGLAKAIEFELEWLTKSDRFKIEYQSEDYKENHALNKNNLTILFRIFQESINNILQHAKATTILVVLKKNKENTWLSVEDNGKGFNLEDVQKQNKGMGLNNLNRRAAIINGSVTFESIIGKGTKVSIQIPNFEYGTEKN
jgi:hypothetical protein